MDRKKIVELRGKAQALKSTVHVGKDGITEKIIEEIDRQLRRTKLVKVRLLPAMEQDMREAADALARACSATLVEVRGRTVVLASE